VLCRSCLISAGKRTLPDAEVVWVAKKLGLSPATRDRLVERVAKADDKELRLLEKAIPVLRKRGC